MPQTRSPHYRAFLLRIWQERMAETAVWRFSLEDPTSGQRRGFASLAALNTFLSQQIAGNEPPDQPPAQ